MTGILLHLSDLVTVTLLILSLLFSAGLIIIFLSSLEDCFIDLLWLSAQLTGVRQNSLEAGEAEERPLAVLVPAWQEAEVLPQSLAHLLTTARYQNFRVFVGVYPNDPATQTAARQVAQQDPRVIPIVNPRAGATCKADCLNAMLQGALAWEKLQQTQFAGFILQDAEDVAHPDALACFNRALLHHDLVQLPVVPLIRRWTACIGGHYMDEFAEMHGKEVPVRALITGIVPGSGVATAYARHVLLAAQEKGGGAFNTDTLTEDYDLSYRLAELAPRQVFLRLSGSRCSAPTRRSDLIATCELFPHRLRNAVRQKARWIVGISFQGWAQLGWRGSLMTRYFYLRDRKIILCGHASLISCFGLLYSLVQLLPPGSFIPFVLPPLLEKGNPLWQVAIINIAFLLYRLLVRHICAGFLYGWQQLPLVVPRYFVGALVNYLALCRATRMFLLHKLTGKPIGWDKTSHDFPAVAGGRQTVISIRPVFEGTA